MLMLMLMVMIVTVVARLAKMVSVLINGHGGD